MRGLAAALEAGLPIDLSLVITDRNAHEVDAMRGLAKDAGLRFRGYANLPSQSPEYLTRRNVFTGCDA